MPACGRKDKNDKKKIDTQTIVLEENAAGRAGAVNTEAAEPAFVKVSGLVRLVGGGPIPQVVITGQDTEWYIPREDDPLLKELQYRTVTVEGYETVVELRFANGLSAGQRHTLKDIKIVNVE